MEKLKWDGTMSARWPALLGAAGPGRRRWLTPAGTRREHPRRGMAETVARDEAAAAEDGRWWVVTARLGEGGAPLYRVDAATPPALEGRTLRFCDLDLDLDLEGAGAALRDVGDFEARARSMGYPPEVQRGAWAGLADAARRHTEGEWPFDGGLVAALRERRATAAPTIARPADHPLREGEPPLQEREFEG